MMAGPEPDTTSGVPGMSIWGWMREPELEWLTQQASEMASIVEVGVLRGRSAFALLTACAGPVYCIDPWDDEGNHAFPAFMADCGHFPNLRPIHGCSPEAAKRVTGKVDMVFLDGDHSYEAVLADIDAWLPKTRKLLCGHDYWNLEGYPGVNRAVNEVFGERVFSPDDTSIWAVRFDD